MNSLVPSFAEPNYVLQCRSVLITWPQSGDLSPETFLTSLRAIPRFPIQFAVVGKERHAAEGQFHIHAYIVLEKKCHIRNAGDVFCFAGNRPNFAVSRVQKHQKGIDYVKKDGNFLEWGVLPEEKERNAKSNAFLYHASESGNADSLKQKLLHDPLTAWDTARSFGAVSKCCDYLFPGTQLGGASFGIEDFNTPPELKNWVVSNIVSIVILHLW